MIYFQCPKCQELIYESIMLVERDPGHPWSMVDSVKQYLCENGCTHWVQHA